VTGVIDGLEVCRSPKFSCNKALVETYLRLAGLANKKADFFLNVGLRQALKICSVTTNWKGENASWSKECLESA
jgi:hypothetical protein